ncbi:MAG TPA: hypothetical protein VK504_13060 [Vicinamibacterales bacterium]|nr:hypothetical protein [Vicinamibacterales bacterium]
MPTITSINPTVERSQRFVRSYCSWAEQAAARAAEDTLTNIQLRALQSQVQAWVTEYEDMTTGDLATELTGFSDLYDDVVAIHTAITDVASTIATALDSETLWSGMSGDDQDVAATSTATPYTLGSPDYPTSADVWSALHPDQKLDLVQHTPVDPDAISDIFDSLTVTYS